MGLRDRVWVESGNEEWGFGVVVVQCGIYFGEVDGAGSG